MTEWEELVAAAERGEHSAQHMLAMAYADGSDDLGATVERDMEKALFWMKKAAMDGYEMAQLTLGSWYTSAYYGIQDLDEAEYWYKKAQAQGSPYAVRWLEKLSKLKKNKE